MSKARHIFRQIVLFSNFILHTFKMSTHIAVSMTLFHQVLNQWKLRRILPFFNSRIFSISHCLLQMQDHAQLKTLELPQFFEAKIVFYTMSINSSLFVTFYVVCHNSNSRSLWFFMSFDPSKSIFSITHSIYFLYFQNNRATILQYSHHL